MDEHTARRQADADFAREERRLAEAVAEAVAAERERCAAVCLAAQARCRDGADVDFQRGYNFACQELADAIKGA